MSGDGLGRVTMDQRLLHLPCHSLVVTLGVVDRVPLGVVDLTGGYTSLDLKY